MLNEDANRIRSFCDAGDSSLRRLLGKKAAASSGGSCRTQAASPISTPDESSEDDVAVVETLVALGVLRSVARRLVAGTVGSPEERVAQALRKHAKR